MRRGTGFAVPVVVFLALTGLLSGSSRAAAWSQSPLLQVLPYFSFGLSVLMGHLFAQSRVFFLSLLLGAIAAGLDHWFYRRAMPAAGLTVTLLAGFYVPILTAVFYHLGERGVFNLHGAIRFVVVGSAIAVILLFPLNSELGQRLAQTPITLFRPAVAWLPVPWGGIILFALCTPLFFWRKPHESPLLGPTLALAMLFALAMLGHRSTFWRSGQERTALLLFASGSALTLAWAVLETTWRNAYLDELTELPGRRALRNHLAELTGTVYSVAIVDVDRFKRINDRHGHDTGDDVLRYIASHLRQFSPGTAYRHGGEEFVIVMDGVAVESALAALDALRRAIQEREFVVRSTHRPRRLSPRRTGAATKPSPHVRPSPDRRGFRITVSMGVAQATAETSPEAVLNAADRALYRAKRAGRNRVLAAC